MMKLVRNCWSNRCQASLRNLFLFWYKMEEDTEYLKLSVEDRCVQKLWKARVSGYEETFNLFRQVNWCVFPSLRCPISEFYFLFIKMWCHFTMYNFCTCTVKLYTTVTLQFNNIKRERVKLTLKNLKMGWEGTEGGGGGKMIGHVQTFFFGNMFPMIIVAMEN